MKKLIVVADDFGFSEAYNYGVIKAHEDGIVTCASLMSNMDAAEHGVRLAQKYPKLCLCQHTNVVQGYCCSDPKDIPSIVSATGKFYKSGEYAPDPRFPKVKSGTRKMNKEDFKREAIAQMERFKQLTGHYPIHVEGHSIINDEIIEAIEEIGKEYSIHVMKYDNSPQEGFLDSYEYSFDHPEYGRLVEQGSKEEYFLNDVFNLLEDPHEIVVLHFHPGYLDGYILDNSTVTVARCRDQQTLTSPKVKNWIKGNNIELITFDDLVIQNS